MKLSMKVAAISFGLLMAAAFAPAQDQAKNSNEVIKSHVRLDFLFTEYNGDKKISSLPYTMYIEAASREPRPGKLRIRDVFHLQVETDIDCSAYAEEDGSYELATNVNRFSVYSAADGQSEAAAIPNANDRPVNRMFTVEFDLELHDGQTMEGASATDPFNGHVLKVSVTLHVIK
ncbi:MAG: hypothetical protein WBD87_12760 [Candidatus Acidiferrales bacterium]